MIKNSEQQLTIVLTLKDRVQFTYRWMRYMNDIKCPYPILIADGGINIEIEDYLLNKQNYTDLDYTYIRYPADKTLSDFYMKFIAVIGLVKTPYLLFADNDDFFLIDQVPVFLDFLNKNPNYTSCGGSNVHLSLLSDSNFMVNSTDATNYIATCTDVNRSVENSNGIERIEHFMKYTDARDLWSCWYQIQRTSNIVAAFDFLNTYQFKDIVAYEIHIHLQLLFRGKYKELKIPFYIRQAGTSQMTAAANSGINLVERFVKNNAIDELHKSINSFNPELSIDDKDRIYRALAFWFVHHGAELYMIGKELTLQGLVKQFLRLLTNQLRRIFWPLRGYFHSVYRIFNLKSGSLHGKYQSMKLNSIEKYILKS